MKIRWNQAAFKQIRHFDTVMSRLNAYGNKLASQCGDGYISHPHDKARSRSRVIVTHGTWRAVADNRRRNTMVKVLAQNRRVP